MSELFEIRTSVTIHRPLKLFGMLHRPLNTHKVPAVLIIHGFASHKVGTHRHYVKIAEELSKNNIASLRIDLQGCGDSEGEISQATFEDFIDDTLAGLNYLENQPYIDQSKIGILGSSLGGALAIFSAHRFKNVKAIVQWAAVASGLQWLIDWKRQHGESTQVYSHHQGLPLNPLFQEQFFKMRADLLSKELDHLSLLNIHGENDEVIPPIHQSAYQFQRAGHEKSRFLTFPESGHALSLSPHYPEILKETVNWFKTIFSV